MPAPFVFKVKSSDSSTVQLEAASSNTPYFQVLAAPTQDLEGAMQLELDLFPLQDGEEINFTPGAHIRIINTTSQVKKPRMVL